ENSADVKDSSLSLESTDTTYSGSCGENATWTYDTKSRTLTISGSGDMYDYSESSPAPWYEFRTKARILIIGDEITGIGSLAFYDFCHWDEITIGKSVKSIRGYAFNGHTGGIKYITFPASLEELDITALYYTCFSRMTFLGDAPKLSRASHVRDSVTLGRVVYYGGSNWTDEYALEFTRMYMLEDSNSVGNVYFYPLGQEVTDKCGDNVTWSLEESENYEGYKKLVISGTGAMYDYTPVNSAPWMEYRDLIKEIVIEDGVTHIGDFSFVQMTYNVKSVYISSTVKTVGKYAFSETYGKDSFIIEDGTEFEWLDEYAFNDVGDNITGIASAIKNSKVLGDSSLFAIDTTEFENLELNVETIGRYAFSNCDIVTLKFGENTKTVGYGAFDYCDKLISVDFGSAAASIETDAFNHATAITSINLGENVKEIGKAAFYRSAVESFVIPDSVTYAEDDCCPKVTDSLYLGKNVTNIKAFYHSLQDGVNVHFTSDYFEHISDITDMNINIYYPGNNISWFYGIDSLGTTTATFIPEGDIPVVTVKFVTNCDISVDDQKLSFGSYATEPEIVNGTSELEGWYTDSDFQTRFDFTQRVFENVTLYAKWSGGTSDNTDTEDESEWGDITEEDIAEKGFTSPADVPSGIWYAGTSEELEYNGNARTFSSLHIYDSKTLLKLKTDYTLKYTNNVKAGTATLTITFNGNYSGTKKIYFTINPLSLKEIEANSDGITVDGVIFTLSYEDKVYCQYTGKAIKSKPSLTLYRNGKAQKLKENTDYTLAYSDKYDYTSEGNHIIYIYGKGNFDDSTSLKFTECITRSSLMSKATVSKIAAQEYTEEEIIPAGIVVKYGKKVLTQGTDYTVSCSNNILPGTAYLTVTGKGDYAGTKTVTFKIKARSISKCFVTGFESEKKYSSYEPVNQDNMVIYESKAAFDANDTAKKLTEGEDYQVSYLNNTKAGTATAIITGTGVYEGTIKKNYKLTGYNIARAKVTGIKTMTFTGDELDPIDEESFKVICSQTELDSSNYTVAFENNVNVGKGKVIITGKGNAYGTKTVNFTIQPFTVTLDNSYITTGTNTSGKKVTIKFATSYAYTKGATEPVPAISFLTDSGNTITLEKNKDFTLSYKNNKKVGNAIVTINFKGNYKGKRLANAGIVASDIANCNAQAKDVKYKNTPGLNKTQVTVYDSNGVKLKAGTDYDKNITYVYTGTTTIYRYSDSKKKIVDEEGVSVKAGTQVSDLDIIPAGTRIRVVITGKGNYESSSSLSCTFKVYEASLSSAKVKVNTTYTYTGSAIKPDYDDITVTIGNTVLTKDDYVISGYSNNVSAGTAKLTITGSGKYVGTKTVTFKINKSTEID
ncbi:MAG: leucine-rich repeat protein, partial [Butyrivibrio sp.]|nr:leucine-rich repeat protein [Butyrivibrio sp.]